MRWFVLAVVVAGCGPSGMPAMPPPIRATPPDASIVPDAEVVVDAEIAAVDAAAPDVPPAPPRVEVRFVVSPRIGSAAPALAVTVRNPSATAVPLTRFPGSPACFAHFYLSITLTGPDGKPRAAEPCVVKAWPGVDGEVGAGGEATVDVPFARLFPGRWATGVYQLDIDWDPSQLEAARPGTGVTASQTSLANAPFAIARARSKFRIRRGATVRLPGGVRLTFVSHGHKHVAAGGPPSPLIVHAAIARGGKPATEVEAHVEDGDPVFQLDDLAFELVDYSYDDWMELRYYGSVVLAL